MVTVGAGTYRWLWCISGGNTGHGNSDIDCNGDYFGEAFIDDCGVCSEGNSGHDANGDQIVIVVILAMHRR